MTQLTCRFDILIDYENILRQIIGLLMRTDLRNITINKQFLFFIEVTVFIFS